MQMRKCRGAWPVSVVLVGSPSEDAQHNIRIATLHGFSTREHSPSICTQATKNAALVRHAGTSGKQSPGRVRPEPCLKATRQSATRAAYACELERDGAMKAFFVQIKCDLGKAYDVASALADAEIASEIYSTAGNYDLLAKFYVDDEEDIGHFVNEKVQILPGIKDTFTVVTFRAF
jgi:DNA-binding Lrp family transcriptional regulator